MRAHSAASPTSIVAPMAVPPAAWISSTVAPGGLMSTATIERSAAASRSAVARPIPEAAPVTMTQLIGRSPVDHPAALEHEGGAREIPQVVAHERGDGAADVLLWIAPPAERNGAQDGRVPIGVAFGPLRRRRRERGGADRVHADAVRSPFL